LKNLFWFASQLTLQKLAVSQSSENFCYKTVVDLFLNLPATSISVLFYQPARNTKITDIWLVNSSGASDKFQPARKAKRTDIWPMTLDASHAWFSVHSTNAYLSQERTCHSAISLPSSWSIFLLFGYCKAIILTIDQLKYLSRQTFLSGWNRRVTSFDKCNVPTCQQCVNERLTWLCVSRPVGNPLSTILISWRCLLTFVVLYLVRNLEMPPTS